MSGVREVENRLDVHEQPDNVPGLQGNPPPRQGRQWDLLQANPSPTSQAFLGLFGGVLAVYGLFRHSIPATGLAIMSFALLA